MLTIRLLRKILFVILKFRFFFLINTFSLDFLLSSSIIHCPSLIAIEREHTFESIVGRSRYTF